MKKIVLCFPNLRWHKEDTTLWMVHPYNICMLAGMIKNEYEVVVIDANIDNLEENEFIAALEKETPYLVGISVLTDEFAPAGHIAARLVKQINPEIFTVTHLLQDYSCHRRDDFQQSRKNLYGYRLICLTFIYRI